MSERDEEQQRQLDELRERKNNPKRRRGHGGVAGPVRGMIATDKPRDLKGTVKKLLKVMGRFKAALFVSLLLTIGSTIFSIVGPKVLSLATTELFEGITAKVAGTGGINYEAIAYILLLTLFLYGLSAAFSFAQGWVLTTVSQKTSFEFRRQIAEKVDKIPVGYFERTSVGDTLSRITNDVDTLGQTLNQGIVQVITAAVTLVGVLAMMLYINFLMTLVTLVLLPLTMLFIRVIVQRSQKYFFQQQESLGEIDGLIEETFSGHAVVKAFNREPQVVETFKNANDVLYESAWKSQFISGLMRPAMDLVGNLTYVVVAIMGAVFATRGIITVGDIQAFIQYVRNFNQPIRQLAQVSTMLQQTAAAAERVFDFLEMPEEEPEQPQIQASACETTVEFDHVRFGYDPENPVISDFTARVEAGQTVALVGPTGAGKTTIVKLLMRFCDVQGGAIRLGGHDLREFSRDDVRDQFGMVLQDTWLFGGTIRDNIRYGNLDATDEEIKRAAHMAFAWHFIETMPGGLDCEINEDGSNISQGQRQLLTIARAFLANRRMLILDEATSSVDTRTEERIQQAMDNLMKGRTSFVIAHRLSTIKNADLILVMREGDIVEQGTHEQLLALGGFYAELYNSQFAD